MANDVTSIEKLLTKLKAPVTGKMRAILSANGITNRSGALSRSCNISLRMDKDGVLSLEMVTPSYAKYIDGWGLNRKVKWATKKGPMSKIPTNYQDPFRALADTIAKQVGPVVVKDILKMIQDVKNDFKNNQ